MRQGVDYNICQEPVRWWRMLTCISMAGPALSPRSTEIIPVADYRGQTIIYEEALQMFTPHSSILNHAMAENQLPRSSL